MNETNSSSPRPEMTEVLYENDNIQRRVLEAYSRIKRKYETNFNPGILHRESTGSGSGSGGWITKIHEQGTFAIERAVTSQKLSKTCGNVI
ncbi:MAG: hypothetical protein WA667_18370 [Candidatus Nitrosopolaris sp.]